MPTDQLLLFIAAGWLLNLTPGSDVLYIVSNALRGGARSGVAAACGITAGCCVHIVAAALGVSALLATSSMAFMVLKWVGAAYLLYTGLRMLLSNTAFAINLEAVDAHSMRTTGQFGFKKVLLGGFWTNALNPKVALFFLAFVPQFIGPTVENKALAFFLLGLLFNVNAIPINLGYALLAAWAAQRMQAVQRGLLWLDRVAGALFITFGVKLALTDNPAS